jgi:pimeloyl-ACP methyl ester carboxylesterase
VGLPTLRFDYLGEGDSACRDAAADQLENWVHSIQSAAQYLRKCSGIERLTLIGLRFGATLAIDFTERHAGVDAIVLLAPLISGRAYARELTLAAKLSVNTISDAPSDAESVGVSLTPRNLARLTDFNILRGPARPVPRALILARKHMAGDQQLSERLRKLGVAIEVAEFTGFTPMMRPGGGSEYPAAAFDHVVNWILPDARPTGSVETCRGQAHIWEAGVTETATVFGSGPGLFGVLCQPAQTRKDARPTLVFLSPGGESHVGPGRMWVSMARHFARLGYTSFRFDVSGVCESLPKWSGAKALDRASQAIVDTGAAIDWLENFNCSRFILVGYCESATRAWKYSEHDDRIFAQILINPWRKFWTGIDADYDRDRPLFRYLAALSDWSKWKMALKHEIPLSKISHAALSLPTLIFEHLQKSLFKMKDKELVRQIYDIRAKAEKGIETHLIFGADDTLLDELEHYFGYGFQELTNALKINIVTIEGVGHGFPKKENRDALSREFENIIDRLTDNR